MAAVTLAIQSAGIDAAEIVKTAGHADGVEYNNLYQPVIFVENTALSSVIITITPLKEVAGAALEDLVYTVPASETHFFRIQNTFFQDDTEVIFLALSGAADPTLVNFSAIKI